MTAIDPLVVEFQTSHRDHLGRLLHPDGLYGPRTQWATELETVSVVRQRAVRQAQVFLDLREDPPGSNADTLGLIAGWLRRCGARPGDPWCASFVSHCLGHLSPAPLIANAQGLGRAYPETSAPFVGDLFWFPTLGVHGHVGIVIGVGPAEVMTIEGNCGNAVRCVVRERAGLRFSLIHPDTSGTCPGLVPGVPGPPGATR